MIRSGVPRRTAAFTRRHLPPAGFRRILSGRISETRETERLGAEARVRWRAVRAGTYPVWCALFVLRPLLAQALPSGARRLLRRLASR